MKSKENFEFGNDLHQGLNRVCHDRYLVTIDIELGNHTAKASRKIIGHQKITRNNILMK